MHRCNASDADLVLDTWGWRLDDLAEAVVLHHKLAGYRGAHWPDWAATRQRLTGAPPEDAGGNLTAPASLWRASYGA